MKPIVHVFNASIVSGPETLALPALATLACPVRIILLSESRREQESRGPAEYARSLGLEVLEIPVRSRLDSSAIDALRAHLVRLDPEVAHAHDVKASTYLLRAAEGIQPRRFPIFSTHHGVRGRFGLKIRLYEEYYTRFVLPRFDRVLTVCSSDRELLLQRGIRSERLRVHLNGVDRPLIPWENRARVAARIRERWGLEARGVRPGQLVLGFLGRLAPEKRVDRILDVCHELERLDPGLDWVLLLFGRGRLESRLRSQVSRLGLEKRVHWMGYRNGVGSEIAGLDLLLSLSDAEGLPINLVEAGWAGTPVLATAVDGNQDLISCEQEGILVPVDSRCSEIASRLSRLLRDGGLRRRIGEAFQGRVQADFSGTKWLGELAALYAEACSEMPYGGLARAGLPRFGFAEEEGKGGEVREKSGKATAI